MGRKLFLNLLYILLNNRPELIEQIELMLLAWTVITAMSANDFVANKVDKLIPIDDISIFKIRKKILMVRSLMFFSFLIVYLDGAFKGISGI